MGLLSRIFSNKEMETIDELAKTMGNLMKKSKSDFICLVGVKGKVKGLEIVTKISPETHFSKKEIQGFNVKMVEYYNKFESLPLIKPRGNFDDEASYKFLEMRYMKLFYSEDYQFYLLPLEFTENLMMTAFTSNIERILKGMVDIQTLLYKLKEERKR